jgi:hypothetical protein
LAESGPVGAAEFAEDCSVNKVSGDGATVRLSFKRNGEVLGEPLITYESYDATPDERTVLRGAVAVALTRCTPLQLSDALGNIIAGLPINLALGGEWKGREAPLKMMAGLLSCKNRAMKRRWPVSRANRATIQWRTLSDELRPQFVSWCVQSFQPAFSFWPVS